MENYLFLLKVVFNSVVAYVFMFAVAKLMGKKQIAQLNFIDYVIGISIGSIGAEMATDYKEPFYIYIIAIGVFFVLEFFMSIIGRKGTIMKKIFIGKPLILIDKGKIDFENLKKSHLSTEELLSLCREKNYFDISDIEYCILETSGKISILPVSSATPTTVSHMGISLPAASLVPTLIIDGQIVENALGQIGRDENWLEKKIPVSREKWKDVILALYDSENDDVLVHMKDKSD